MTLISEPMRASDIVFPDAAAVADSTIPTSDLQAAEGDRWAEFGFKPTAELGTYTLPDSVVAFETNDEGGNAKLTELMKAMAVPPRLAIKVGTRRQLLFRLSNHALAGVLAQHVPPGVALSLPGDTVALPRRDEWQQGAGGPASIADLSTLTSADVELVANPAPAAPIVTNTPLKRFSLLGQSAVFREQAVEATPLLGDLCLNGQVTVWYAAPNAGKTLIALNLLIEAVKVRRIDGANAYYVNADDGSEGLATKMELMDDIGVHTLAPGCRDFKPDMLVPKLLQMADKDEARGVFVLVDTTKKFTSLMDKKLATAYGAACRQVAMRGGAVLNLAHVNKAPKADGTPQFAGTTDLVDDADAAYMMVPLEFSASPGERVVEFRNFKRRGNNVQSAAYGYAAEDGVSYVERLSSVRPIDLATLDQFKRVEVQRADEDVIAAIAACIADGHNTKMFLSKEAAKRAGITDRAAYRILERYTGTDPLQHRWRFTTQARGAKVFEVLPPPPG